MDKLKYAKLKQNDGIYTDKIPLFVDGKYIDINGNILIKKLDKKTNKIETSALYNQVLIQKNRIDNLATLEDRLIVSLN